MLILYLTAYIILLKTKPLLKMIILLTTY